MTGQDGRDGRPLDGRQGSVPDRRKNKTPSKFSRLPKGVGKGEWNRIEGRNPYRGRGPRVIPRGTSVPRRLSTRVDGGTGVPTVGAPLPYRLVTRPRYPDTDGSEMGDSGRVKIRSNLPREDPTTRTVGVQSSRDDSIGTVNILIPGRCPVLWS